MAEVRVEYEEFVAARLQPLLRYAVMLTGDPHLAEDLVQDTMVRVQLKWKRVAAADIPESYVKRMLTNAYVDLRRGSWLRRVALRADPNDGGPPVPDHAVRSADRDEVWTLLARLPRKQRAALVLRFYEELDDTQAAEVLDCAVGTIRSLVSRALANLREHMAEPAPASLRGEIA
jgi:RNA polymerase sigma-70 factor (sigma-E family)